MRVRIVTVDPVGPLPADWRRRVGAYAGLGGLFESVEVEFGRESSGIECSRRDAFIATTWWTAHVARAALAELEGERFVYLIQEYEPFTFPMGTLSALARQSYDFPHFAVFSSELLREWFRAQGIGVAARGPRLGLNLIRERDHACVPAAGAERCRRAARGGCCSTPAPSRTPPATCSSSACWRSPGRFRTARSTASGSSTGSARSAGAAGSRSGARRCASSRARTSRRTPSCFATTTSGSR